MSDESAYPFYEFTGSGLTHVNEEYPQAPNDYRVAGPYVDLNFGLVEIDWDADPTAVIAFRVLGLDGESALEHRVSLADLRARGGGGDNS